MRLRFVDQIRDHPEPLRLLDDKGYRCDWCGFEARVGMRAYEDDDGAKCACSVCFGARHAAILPERHKRRFRIIWAPEIGQPQLAHLARVIAHGRFLSESPSTAKHFTIDGVARQIVDPGLFEELERRGKVLDKSFQDSFGGSVVEVLPTLPEDVRETLMDGLRMLPIAFTESEMEGWRTDESWFDTYGADAIAHANWFVASMGLPTIAQIHAGKETRQ
jgi:hypothetical protein